MSKLPTGWEQITLGEAVQIQKGKKPVGLGAKGNGRTVPYINISAFETKQIDEYAPEQDAPRCESSDTLLVWDGARAGLSGRGVSGFVGSTLSRLTSDLMEPSYLYYFVQSNYRYLNAHTKGVGIPHIDPVVLMGIELPLPPASEQTRIVKKLEELLADLDAGVAELKAAQQKLAQCRQSLLKAAVEGQLTADWRCQHTPTETGAELLSRILKERRARWEAKQQEKFASQGKIPPKNWQHKYPEPVAPDTRNLPKLPKNWVWASLDQLAAIGTGVTPLKSKKQYYLDGDIPWVTSGALNNEIVTESTEYVTRLALRECRLELYPAGSLLVAMYGEGKTRGKCSELAIPATINQAIAALVLEESAVTCKAYIKSFLLKSYKDMRSQASGGVQPNLNLQIIRSIAVPLPPLSEQVTIDRALLTQLNSIKQQAASIELALRQATTQRQNILRATFAGELVPQDPNDEPASILLERIRAARAERAQQPKPKRAKRKEINTVDRQLIDVLTDANDWLTTQEAFSRCGVADGASTERIEELYVELRQLDKTGLLAVEPVRDKQGRKLHDKLKLMKS